MQTYILAHSEKDSHQGTLTTTAHPLDFLFALYSLLFVLRVKLSSQRFRC